METEPSIPPYNRLSYNWKKFNHKSEVFPQMAQYEHLPVEQKWQQAWEEAACYQATNDDEREKFYCLVEFPYPSGEGLHVGHPRSYTALDVVARYKRMQGLNVLYPMGWDAFGLPTENYAIKNHIHPALVTERNVARFKSQLQSLGCSFDWSREINTTDPKYYKWTQWIFLQLFKHGLAYKKEMAVNWCPSCKCVLANEEVVQGSCERCGSTVIRRVKSQWMLRITDYAEKLLEGLDEVNFVERVKTQQRNWIGRSEGAEIDFPCLPENQDSGAESAQTVRIFTTRPDTLFGATYMVFAPEHPYVQHCLDQGLLRNAEEVEAYRLQASQKSDFDRGEMNKEKTGVRLEGVTARNPISGEALPIYIADYVLISYGTGAIMAVPAHDERDWAFARAHGLPLREVIAGGNPEQEAYTDTQSGQLVNSDFLNGLEVAEAKERIIARLEELGLGSRKVNYKLRDWVFSRQRYWGEPIPMVYCEHCGWQPLPESELPLELPQVESYEPGPDGESPLAALEDWKRCSCPKCGGPAQRETDTMPQWAGSSWYFLRYMDPHNDQALASPEALAYWSPVDWYNGGMEHTTLHLLYSRFWHKFLHDIGVVPTAEPYSKRSSHGMILGEDGQKMSKSRGNVINPDEIVENYGADTMRLYEMFIGDFEKPAPWSTKGIRGCRRFVERIWNLHELYTGEEALRPALARSFHKTIRKVGRDIEQLKNNTAIAALMSLLNEIYATGSVSAEELSLFCRLLSPFAPHIAEELAQRCRLLDYVQARQAEILPREERHRPFVCRWQWPQYDEELCRDAEIQIAIQVNGKVRAKMLIPAELDQAEVLARAKAEPQIQAQLQDKQLVKEIYIPGRLVNLVART